MKNLVYYKRSSRPAGKRRRTNRPSIIRPVVILTLFFGFSLSFCYFVYKAAPKVKAKISSFQKEGYNNWEYKTAEIKGLSEDMKKRVLEIITFAPGQNVSTEDARNLKKRLELQFPEIKNIKVKRGLISGKLRIFAAPREIISEIVTPLSVRFFLDSEGKIYSMSSAAPAAGSVSAVLLSAGAGAQAKPPQNLPQEIVQLIKTANGFKKDLPFTTLYVDSAAGGVKLLLKDSSVIDFGDGEDMAKKAKTASKILEYNKSRVKAPFEIDFKYFSGGKVYLRPLEVNTQV